MNRYLSGGCCCLLVGLWNIIIPVFADNPTIIPESQLQADTIQGIQDTSDTADQAKQWGLTTEEFNQYDWLMSHTPSGQWYKTLDPAEVLALNAKDAKEIMHYALIQAHNMHLRVSQELTFNKMYALAYHALYPNEKPIMSPMDKRPMGETLQSGDHIWLFIDINAALGRFVYQHLMQSIQAIPNTRLDIYFVGDTVSQESIDAWAQAAGISSSLVNQKLTLNVGNQRFQEITEGKDQAWQNLPLVGIVRNKQFQLISLSSVLQSE